MGSADMRGVYRVRAWAGSRPQRGPAVMVVAILVALGVLSWWTGAQPFDRPITALLAFVALCEVAALGGMLLVRRSVQLATLEAHMQYAGFVYATLGAAYAVLLSFMVVVSWNAYSEAQRTTAQEALTVATLFHLADG